MSNILKTLKTNIRAGWTSIRTQFTTWNSLFSKLKLYQKGLFLSAAAAGLVIGYMMLGPWMFLIQSLGFIPVIINQAALVSIKDSKILHAILGPSALITAIQKIILGGYGYAANAGLFCLRALTFSSLSDEWLDQRNRRLKLAAGFWAAGIPIIAALGLYHSTWHFLPGISMTLGIAATALSSSSVNNEKDKSHYTRILYLAANSLNATYSALFSRSLAGFIADTMNIRGLIKGIEKFDMLAMDEKGAWLSRKQRALQYAVKITSGESAPGMTFDQIEKEEHFQIWQKSPMNNDERRSSYESWIQYVHKNINLKQHYRINSMDELRKLFPFETVFTPRKI